MSTWNRFSVPPSIIHATHTPHHPSTVPVPSMTVRSLNQKYSLWHKWCPHTTGSHQENISQLTSKEFRPLLPFFFFKIHILFWRIKFLYHENGSVCPALAPVSKARKRCSITLGANLRITNCNSDHCYSYVIYARTHVPQTHAPQIGNHENQSITSIKSIDNFSPCMHVQYAHPTDVGAS